MSCAVCTAAGNALPTVRPLTCCPWMLLPVLRMPQGVGTAHDIDAGMKLGTNQPMGPLALAGASAGPASPFLRSLSAQQPCSRAACSMASALAAAVACLLLLCCLTPCWQGQQLAFLLGGCPLISAPSLQTSSG